MKNIFNINVSGLALILLGEITVFLMTKVPDDRKISVAGIGVVIFLLGLFRWLYPQKLLFSMEPKRWNLIERVAVYVSLGFFALTTIFIT